MLNPAHVSQKSALYNVFARWWKWDVLLASPQEYVGFFDIYAAGAGSLVSSGFYPRCIQSLCFSQFAAGATVVYEVKGYNQFGNLCVETLTLAGTCLVETLNCYRQVVSITMVSKALVPAGSTLSVGIGNYDIRLPSYSGNLSQQSILQITVDTPLAPPKDFVVDNGRSTIMIPNYVSGLVIAHLNHVLPGQL